MGKLSPSLPGLVRLRGHHLLCLFGFRGLGYDEAFVQGMCSVVRQLRQPETMVEIIAGPDDLCAQCPHRQRENCTSPANTRDSAVLRAAGVAVGDIKRASDLFSAVALAISPSVQRTLCEGCSWFVLDYCTQGLQSGKIAADWHDENHQTVDVADGSVTEDKGL